MTTKERYHLFAIFLSVLKISQGDYLDMDDIKYYDKFGEPTSLVHTQGYMTFYCRFTCDGTNEIMIIDPDGNVKERETCTTKMRTWRINFDKEFKFGAYGCRYKDKDGAKIEIKYRICDDQDETCAEEESCTGLAKFCLITTNGAQSCSKIPDENWCKNHVPESNIFTFCPVNDQSLCGSISKNYLRTFALVDVTCNKADEAFPRIYYQSRPYVYLEPIHVRATDKSLTVSYSNNVYHDDSNLTCVLKNRKILDRDVIETLNAKILHSATVTLDDTIFDRGSAIYSFHCSFFKPKPKYGDRARAALWNILVVIGGRLVINRENDAASLSCQLDPFPGPEFLVLFWWTMKGSALVHRDSTIIIREPGEYKCHASIAYKTCSPYRKFQYALHSESFLVSSVPTSISADKSSPNPVSILNPASLNPDITATPSSIIVHTCKPDSTSFFSRQPLFVLAYFCGYTVCVILAMIII